MKVTILGCGASGGVPLIGANWGNCDPANPRNRRRRASILVEDRNTRILVDVSPDCRAQLLDAEVAHLDAVLFTHVHADHCHGIDELRWVNNVIGAPLDVYGAAASFEELNRRFGYAFEPFIDYSGTGYYYRPVLHWQAIDGPLEIGDVSVLPFEQDHGFSKTLGLRFGSFAYSTDVVALDDKAFDCLAGVETWVVGCLREEWHKTHANLETVLEWAERLGPRRVVLTHMSHWLDYQTLKDKLPTGIEPAYDGMVLDIRQ